MTVTSEGRVYEVEISALHDTSCGGWYVRVVDTETWEGKHDIVYAGRKFPYTKYYDENSVEVKQEAVATVRELIALLKDGRRKAGFCGEVVA